MANPVCVLSVLCLSLAYPVQVKRNIGQGTEYISVISDKLYYISLETKSDVTEYYSPKSYKRNCTEGVCVNYKVICGKYLHPKSEFRHICQMSFSSHDELYMHSLFLEYDLKTSLDQIGFEYSQRFFPLSGFDGVQ